MNKDKANFLNIILLTVFVVLLVVINVGPILWGLLTSVKPDREILAFPPHFFPYSPTFEHYQRIVESGFGVSIRNSIFYSFLTILLGLFLGSLGAYSFDRFNFPGKKLLFFLVLAGIPMSIGSSAILIPTYVFLAKLGITNKWFTLIPLYTAYNLPMVTWILKGTFETIPKELDEAAKLDGCSRFSTLVKIVLPLARPGLAASSIFLFVGAWNDFITASIMVSSPQLSPVQLSIYHFLGFFGREWGPLTASAITALIPILMVFIFLQKHFVSGLTRGAIK